MVGGGGGGTPRHQVLGPSEAHIHEGHRKGAVTAADLHIQGKAL